MIWRGLLVFCVAFAVDWAYAFYIRRTSEGRAVPAALWSGVIAFAGAYNVLSYTKSPWLLVPMVAGYITGTYVAVKRDAK